MIGWLLAAGAAMAAYALGPESAAVLKPLPVAILALGVLVSGDRPGARILAGAMAVDAVADAVIEVSFLGGLGLFLVGHLLRIGSCTTGNRALRANRGAPFLVLAAGVSALVAPAAGPLALPIAAYAFTISAMAWRAAANVDGSAPAWLGLLGALLYLASDALLAVTRFVVPLPWDGLWVMSTYWGAQAAIAASSRSGRAPGGIVGG